MEQASKCGQQDEEHFDEIITELTKIKDDYVVKIKNWYKDHAWPQMVLFRVSSVLIILLSISIPFLVSLEGIWKETVLPLVALTIAGMTGLNSFFKWEINWKKYRQTQYTLEYFLTIWDFKIIEAKKENDKEKIIELAMKATEELLNDARLVTSSETQEYFKRVQFPQITETE